MAILFLILSLPILVGSNNFGYAINTNSSFQFSDVTQYFAQFLIFIQYIIVLCVATYPLFDYGFCLVVMVKIFSGARGGI